MTVAGVRTEEAAGDRSTCSGNEFGAEHLDVGCRRNSLAQIVGGDAKRGTEIEQVGRPSWVAPRVVASGRWRGQDVQLITPAQSDHLAKMRALAGKGRQGEEACGQDNAPGHAPPLQPRTGTAALSNSLIRTSETNANRRRPRCEQWAPTAFPKIYPEVVGTVVSASAQARATAEFGLSLPKVAQPAFSMKSPC